MLKYLKFYLLNRLVNNPLLASQIYHMIYHDGVPPKGDAPTPINIYPQTFNFSRPENNSTVSAPTSKRQQLTEALQYLKSKKEKTQQDKESISIIEATLINEK